MGRLVLRRNYFILLWRPSECNEGMKKTETLSFLDSLHTLETGDPRGGRTYTWAVTQSVGAPGMAGGRSPRDWCELVSRFVPNEPVGEAYERSTLNRGWRGERKRRGRITGVRESEGGSTVIWTPNNGVGWVLGGAFVANGLIWKGNKQGSSRCGRKPEGEGEVARVREERPGGLMKELQNVARPCPFNQWG